MPDGQAQLTVFLARGHRVSGAPAHERAIACLREHGLYGANVLLGLDGTVGGARQRARLLSLVVAVGEGGALATAVPELAEMLGMPMALERVQVCKRDGTLLAAPAPPPGTGIDGLSFWQKLTVCTSCRVVAGEFAEDSEKEHIDYIETYLKYILYDRYQHSGKARNVGFHDYQDIVNVPKSLSHYTNPAARRFAAIVKHRFGGHAHILFSEQGVELQYGYGATRLAQSQAPKEYKSRQLRAAEDFMKLADGLPNVDVVNYYEYLGVLPMEVVNAGDGWLVADP